MTQGIAAYPLSHHQQGIWLHQQQAPLSVVYNTGMALQILGEVDIRALRQTLHAIMQRHSMLRAVFELEGGQPVQRVLAEQRDALVEIGATGWDDEQLRREVQAAHYVPYDLAQGPPFRAHLFSQSSARHVLLMGAHHLVVDAGSWLLVLEELRRDYPIFCADAELASAPPESSYFDYAAVQSELAQTRWTELRAYWQSRLAEIPNVLALPTDRPRPAELRFEGGSHFFSLSPELTEALSALAKQQRVTLNAVLLGGYQLLLHRYAQVDQFVVGVPASNRLQPQSSAAVGNFINVLPIPADLSLNPTVKEHIRQVWRSLLTGLRHQAYPFSRIVQDLNIPHTPAIPPLAQVLFSFPQTTPELSPFLLTIPGAEDAIAPFPWGGLSLRPYGLQQQDGGFDLGLEMVRTPDQCVGIFKYSADLFRADTIQRMCGHFVTLLKSMAARPLDRVADLPLMTELERRQVLVEWNRTETPGPQTKCIHHLFEEQAELTPDAVAAVHGERSLTYKELNRQANQLAHYLISQSVRPEVLTGICMERSLMMVVAVLGVLKAGGAYVPLDPSYPPARLRVMLDEAQVSLVLTQSGVRDVLPTATPQVALDQIWESLQSQASTNPILPLELSNLAYCIFTSGSTGQPKGVLVEHRGVPNLVAAQIAEFGLHARSRVLQFASFSFDAFVSELFTTLLAGATLCLPDAGALPIGETLHQQLVVHGITAITLPPSVLATLPPYYFETLIVAGEACPPAVARQWLSRCKRFINAYGPTEATVCVTMARLTGGDISDNPLPAGGPISNAQLYILDSRLQPVPIGVPGELYIGGRGLARGYVNRPEWTREKFIPNPFASPVGSERIYKTGDLCRYLTDGRVQFLGRTDGQVKLRGFRIELGEIENALLKQNGVSIGLAIVREDEPGIKRLVAYYTGSADVEVLRQQLGLCLPSYMVPAALVMLDRMPLTVNGKLDRRALPAPNYAERKADFIAPRNEAEIALALAFAEVLRIPEVGIHDNFFRLGGDSIMCIGVTSRVARQGYAITVNHLFRYPTVAKLAASMDLQSTPRVLASQDGQSGDAPLLPIQRWFLATNEAALHHFNQYLLLTVKERIEPAQLKAAVAALLHHHDALRFRYTKEETGWRQEYLLSGGSVQSTVFELAGSLANQRAEMESIAARTQTSLNPLVGDLTRFVYFRGSAQDHLLIVIHHLAVDGVSWRILIEDLTVLLNGGELPAKTNSYADWGNALWSAAQNGRFNSEVNHWLAVAPDVHFPLDHAAAPRNVAASHHLSATLSAFETNALLRTLPDLHDITLDSVLLTALTETFTHWAKSDDLPVSFESHGRPGLFDTVNLDRTVGWFTAAYPLSLSRVDGSAMRRIRYTLDRIRCIPNGGVSFGVLRDFHPDAAVRAQLAALPPLAVAYNYLGQLDALSNERFGVNPEAAGLSASADFHGMAPVESNALVINGQLRISWTVRPQIELETAQALFSSFLQTLSSLLDSALHSRESVAIPSDYPNADLQINQVEDLFRDPVRQANGNAPIQMIYALSPMQSGMLFQATLGSARGTYIEQSVFQVADLDFDPNRFIASIQKVIGKYDCLRAGFQSLRDGQEVQVIYANVQLPVAQLDWQNLSASEYPKCLAEKIESERLTDFDVRKAPLLRLTIITRGRHAWDIIFTFHHVVLDRWSVDLFWSEVQRTYAGSEGAVAAPYEAYISHLRSQSFDQSFWRDYLKGFPAPTPLPGLTTPNREHSGSASCRATFSRAETKQLAAFAREQGVTLNVLFEAAWAVLLARYTRETDVVFGMVTSGRTAPIAHIESMCGLLINTLPFRVNLEGGVSTEKLLQQITQTQLELQRREHAPLVEVQRASQVPPGTSLFQTLFLFQNTPQADLNEVPASGRPLRLVPGRVEPGHNGYPLMLLVSPSETTELTLVYDTAHYNAGTVEQLAGGMNQLLTGMLAVPKKPVLELPLLSAAEREQIVRQWSGADKAPLKDVNRASTIHEMFERQVECCPEAVALTFEGEQLTYADLNARANRLAHHLIELGVCEDELVPVVMGRSPDLVVSLLAVLKAGGAYVPVDPTYPVERIAFTLSDCAAQIVLTDRCLMEQLPKTDSRYVFLSDQLLRYPAANPSVSTTPDQLAYVIYTSGSTGQPKGVLISHRNVSRLFAATDHWFGFGSDDVWTLFHSFAFDFSVWEMWGALCYGGRLVIVPYSVSRDPRSFYKLIAEQQVTVLNHTPSAFRQLIAVAGEEHRQHSLRYVIFGGEALQFESLRPWFAQFGDSSPQLVNMYGITETTVHVTYQPVRLEHLNSPGGRSRIGKPLPDLQLYILDDYGAPVPVGVAGELYVAGAGLARGYLNRSELTAERFIEHAELGRLYKTGDLCRWLPEQNVEYLGRTDFQVKIRGFRVELGEIESALRAEPGVREAVALVREDQTGDKRIVAYLVCDAASDGLREKLLQRLPEYMVPSAFVKLDALPLTANGKLDRSALPAPDFAETQSTFVAPRTPIEEEMSIIWREVLGVEKIGIHDNFFALGGHSLSATRVAAHVRNRFQSDLPMKTIFEAKSLMELATAVEVAANYQRTAIAVSERDEEF